MGEKSAALEEKLRTANSEARQLRRELKAMREQELLEAKIALAEAVAGPYLEAETEDLDEEILGLTPLIDARLALADLIGETAFGEDKPASEKFVRLREKLAEQLVAAPEIANYFRSLLSEGEGGSSDEQEEQPGEPEPQYEEVADTNGY